MQDSNPGINAEKDDTRTRLIGADDREATIRLDTPSPAPTPSPEPEPSGNTPRRRRAWIYVVIALIVIAVGAAVAYFVITDKDKDNDRELSTADMNEVPGVNDTYIDAFLNTVMDARYDKSTDQAVATPDTMAVVAAPMDTAAAVW